MFLLKILRFQSLFDLKRHFIGMLGLWQFFRAPFLDALVVTQWLIFFTASASTGLSDFLLF